MLKVYTTNACAYCKMVKQYLTMKGKEYEVINLDDNPEVRQSLFEKVGAMTVPIVQAGDQYVIGWNRQRLAEVI